MGFELLFLKFCTHGLECIEQGFYTMVFTPMRSSRAYNGNSAYQAWN